MSPKSFRKNVLVWRRKMLLIALKTLNNEHDAEDVIQEVFLKLWVARASLHKIEKIEAYLTTMVKNRCLDKIKLKKQNVDVTEVPIVSGQTFEEDFQNKETVEIIAYLIEQLPELQKIMIKMHDMDGYTTAEIAKNTGTSVEAIRMNLSRARKRVRDMYQQYLDHEK